MSEPAILHLILLSKNNSLTHRATYNTKVWYMHIATLGRHFIQAQLLPISHKNCHESVQTFAYYRHLKVNYYIFKYMIIRQFKSQSLHSVRTAGVCYGMCKTTAV